MLLTGEFPAAQWRRFVQTVVPSPLPSSRYWNERSRWRPCSTAAPPCPGNHARPPPSELWRSSQNEHSPLQTQQHNPVITAPPHSCNQHLSPALLLQFSYVVLVVSIIPCFHYKKDDYLKSKTDLWRDHKTQANQRQLRIERSGSTHPYNSLTSDQNKFKFSITSIWPQSEQQLFNPFTEMKRQQITGPWFDNSYRLIRSQAQRGGRVPETFSLKMRWKICWKTSSLPVSHASPSSRSMSAVIHNSNSSFSGHTWQHRHRHENNIHLPLASLSADTQYTRTKYNKTTKNALNQINHITILANVNTWPWRMTLIQDRTGDHPSQDKTLLPTYTDTICQDIMH